jgi:hypothetical protein
VASVVGVRTVLTSDRGAPADAPTRTTTSLNGISITHPEGWFVFDADELGLNGTTDAPPNPRVGLPRLVLAVSPVDAGELFGCPGIVEEGPRPASLMTIQEGPLALAGESAEPWPASLEPLPIESAGNDVVESGEGGCYPGWEFLRAGWTAEGRTFEARVGFAPDVSDAERDAMRAAFASMTFEPGADGPASAVLASGTAGGVGWRLVAEGEPGQWTLVVEGEDFSFGTIPEETGGTTIFLFDHVFGQAAERERLVVGAVSTNVVRVEVVPQEWLGTVVTEVLDVPDVIDPGLNAFAFNLPVDVRATVNAYDASGAAVASAQANPAPTGPASADALEDGRHFGFVRSVDVTSGTIGVDVAEWLTGNEAVAAATERGDEVTDDYYIVNDDTTSLTLPIAPDVELVLLDWNRCCAETFHGDLATFATAVSEQRDVTDGDLVYRGTSSWWVTVRDGLVVRIEEQFRP